MKKRIKRIAALVAALVMCCTLTVPALADELLTGRGSFYIGFAKSSPSSFSSEYGSYSSYTDVSQAGLELKSSSSSDKLALYGVAMIDSALLPADSSVGIYLSFWYRSRDGFKQSKAPTVSDFSIGVLSAGAASYSFKSVSSVSLFQPSDSMSSVSDGVSIVARVENTLGSPYSSWLLRNAPASSATGLGTGPCSFYISPVSSWTSSGYPSFAVSSFRVVSSSSSAELDSLENIASQITEQNEQLSAYYGDIVAICNQIYSRLGDMEQTQQEANALLSSLVSLLDSTNGKISALNQAMSTYFELVLKSLENESLSIQDCINDAELRLETYLKPMIDYFTELEEQTGESASTLPQHKTDIDGFDNQGYGIDGDGQAGLAALVPIFSSFSWIFSVIAIFVGVGIINLLVKKGLS